MTPRTLGLLLLFTLPACAAKDDTGATNDTAETGDTGDTGDTAGTGDTAADGAVTLGGGFNVWDNGNDVDGGSVCWTVDTTERCADTNRTGKWSIDDVPPGAEGVLWFESDEVVTSLLPLVVGKQDLDIAVYFESPALHDSFYEQAGVEDSPTLATISVQAAPANGTSGSGATVQLSGGGAYEGPFYMDESGLALDPTLDATTSSGLVYFLAVDPSGGPWTLTVNRDDMSCVTPLYGDAVPTFETPAGTTVNLLLTCE